MQRYFANARNGSSFVLSDGDIHHITNVMRMHSGDFIEVVYEGILYKCCVHIDSSFSILFDSVIDDSFDDCMDITLIVPVLKEQKMDFILQKSTELGVNRIIPIITERCVVKVADKEDKKICRWTRIVKEASEQCKRKSIPIIDNVRHIDDLIFSDGVKFVCSTRENKKISKI